jgi:hypothetical protein
MTRDDLVEAAKRFAEEHYPDGWKCGVIEFQVGKPDEYECFLVRPAPTDPVPVVVAV